MRLYQVKTGLYNVMLFRSFLTKMNNISSFLKRQIFLALHQPRAYILTAFFDVMHLDAAKEENKTVL